MAKDVVCGMQIDEQQARSQGLTYYFCSANCKRQFDQNPQQYTGQQTAQQ